LGGDGLAFRQEPSQHVVHQVQTFLLGGLQDLQVLLDRPPLVVPGKQLVVGHPKPRGGVHVVDILIVDKRARLADQGVDHVAKVDPLFALAKQSRQTFQALVLIPEFQMVLVDQHVQLQADVLAVDGIDVLPHTQDAIRFDRHLRGRERGEA
jgi:hypothetical protein